MTDKNKLTIKNARRHLYKRLAAILVKQIQSDIQQEKLLDLKVRGQT